MHINSFNNSVGNYEWHEVVVLEAFESEIIENFIKAIDPDIFHEKKKKSTFCTQLQRVPRSQVKKPSMFSMFTM